MDLQRKKEDGIADVSSAWLGSRRTEAGGRPTLPGVVVRRAPFSFKLPSSTAAYWSNAALWSRRSGLNAKRENGLLRHRCR